MKNSPKITKDILLAFENGKQLAVKGSTVLFQESTSMEDRFNILSLLAKGYIVPVTDSQYFLSTKGQILLSVLSNKKILEEEEEKLMEAGFDEMIEPLLLEMLMQRAGQYSSKEEKKESKQIPLMPSFQDIVANVAANVGQALHQSMNPMKPIDGFSSEKTEDAHVDNPYQNMANLPSRSAE